MCSFLLGSTRRMTWTSIRSDKTPRRQDGGASGQAGPAGHACSRRGKQQGGLFGGTGRGYQPRTGKNKRQNEKELIATPSP
jgi:hypothetical protein